MSEKNIGKLCRIRHCKLIYKIEGYSKNHCQYLLRAQEFSDDCLYYGWVETGSIDIVYGESPQESPVNPPSKSESRKGSRL